jgi:hypothetical protein
LPESPDLGPAHSTEVGVGVMKFGQLWRGLVVLLCAAATMAGPSTTADATTSKLALQRGDIVYSTRLDDNSLGDLWLVHSDGTGATPLTTSGTAVTPDWSPNGRRIAFVQDGDVWVMTPATGATKRLTHAGGAEVPAWSPDGTTIAYVRGHEVWNVRVSTAQAARVTWMTKSSGCGVLSRPTWTPNGQAIVYARATLTGDKPCAPGVARQRPGSTAHLLIPGAVGVRGLAYTSDGKHLLYIGPCTDECFRDAVFESTPAGSDVHQIVSALDQDWDCLEGDLCTSDLRAAATGGWVQSGVFANDNGDSPHTCFEGLVESSPGMGTQTDDPSICVSGIASFDIR